MQRKGASRPPSPSPSPSQPSTTPLTSGSSSNDEGSYHCLLTLSNGGGALVSRSALLRLAGKNIGEIVMNNRSSSGSNIYITTTTTTTSIVAWSYQKYSSWYWAHLLGSVCVRERITSVARTNHERADGRPRPPPPHPCSHFSWWRWRWRLSFVTILRPFLLAVCRTL